ncbi:MAG TPA: inositol monophosphatase family protein, partial [Trebonia sp.]|nr:inositol monophosphatase family protein [Trebonia sp.]
EMDRRAEALIRSRILAARPHDAVLGEEEGQTGDTAGAPARWVVDPLDGTVNYLYGLHDWGVSVAAEVAWDAGQDAGAGGDAGGEVGGAEGGEVGRVVGGEVGRKIVAGAVYIPMRRELFSAVRGGGAWLESEWIAPGSVLSGPDAPDMRAISEPGGIIRTRLRCRAGVPLGQALVGTGFGYLTARRKVQGDVVAALLPRVRDIRRAGVASADLCSVAAGRLDGYYERGLHYWDYAAGALIAAEAGAVVGGLNGAPVSGSMLVAAGPGLFGPLAEALSALDPERDA